MSRPQIAAVDPATGELLEAFAPASAAEVEGALAAATRRFDSWRRTPVADRARLLLRAAERLEAERSELAATMTAEMGKLLSAATAEVEKCALACRYYAENAAAFLAPQRVETGAAESWIRHEPLGVVLAVMPWNFPLWQVFRFAAPALAAGNVGILKHASNVPRAALAIERVLREAGFPDGCFRTLLIESSRVEGLIADPRIAAVTLTGSEPAGRAVAAAAGRAIKKTVLELGGSDPFLVLPSADLARAAEVAVRARTINNGQSCIAAKRFIVHDAVYDAFERDFVGRLAALRVGDPRAPTTEVGPLATPAILAELEQQVAATVAAGGRLLCGGSRLAGPGNFYAPTAIAEPPAGSPGHEEELFGPVACLFRARDLGHAIAIANRSEFGLGASVWTGDRAEAERAIAELETGTVCVNAMVASDPRLPFGGIKRSGYGRELSRHGLLEFVNVKSASIDAL